MWWQHTVRWAGRWCSHGGCYPCISCSCYGTHIKISKPSTVSSILKYREYLTFSYSWTELQGQINNNTSTPWEKNSNQLKFTLDWWSKWTETNNNQNKKEIRSFVGIFRTNSSSNTIRAAVTLQVILENSHNIARAFRRVQFSGVFKYDD